MNKAIILSLSVLSLAACSPEQEKTAGAVDVNVIHPESYQQNGRKSYDFISEPYRTTELSFRIGGPVQLLDLESGQFFRKGSLIAGIDPRDYQTALQKAEANVAQKRSEYKRIESLYRKNNVSASSYEQAQAELKTAEANYLEAQHNLRDTRMTAPTDGYVQQAHSDIYRSVADKNDSKHPRKDSFGLEKRNQPQLPYCLFGSSVRYPAGRSGFCVTYHLSHKHFLYLHRPFTE